MTLTPISLGSSSNPSRFGAGGVARLVNCYQERQGEDAKADPIIVASDGLTVLATASALGTRALLEVGVYVYGVIGREIVKIGAGGTLAVLGGIPTNGPVYMVRNRRTVPQVAIVSDGLYYVIDTGTDVITQISSAVLPPATSLAFFDGYGLLSTTRNGQWFATAIDNFSTIDPLSFGDAESNPDDIVRIATREGEVVVFGTRSTEWFQDTGAVNFAFTRSQAAEIGCLSAGSVAFVDRTLFWVAHDGSVRQMQGYGGARVSTHAVERAIAGVDPSTILATTWWQGGHTFYAISCASWTWVYDLATSKWHERESYGQSRWRVSCVARFGNAWLAGDSSTGDLYIMSPDVHAESFDPLILTVQTPPVHAFPKRLQFSALYLDIVPGVGLAPTTTSGASSTYFWLGF